MENSRPTRAAPLAAGERLTAFPVRRIAIDAREVFARGTRWQFAPGTSTSSLRAWRPPVTPG